MEEALGKAFRAYRVNPYQQVDLWVSIKTSQRFHKGAYEILKTFLNSYNVESQTGTCVTI